MGKSKDWPIREQLRREKEMNRIVCNNKNSKYATLEKRFQEKSRELEESHKINSQWEVYGTHYKRENEALRRKVKELNERLTRSKSRRRKHVLVLDEQQTKHPKPTLQLQPI